MATVILDENTPQDGLEFQAFDESRSGLIKKAGQDTILSSGSNPSSIIDDNSFRQGVEITTEAYRFQGVGPKIWAGNIKGYTQIRTLGQTIQFTEAQNDKAYTEKQSFNPVEYVDNPNYPFPLFFNEGPANARATRVQPLTIFNLLGDENVDNPAHQVCGNVEDGNPYFDEQCGANSRIQQFIDLNDHSIFPFLEEGQEYIGQNQAICLPIDNSPNTYDFFTFNSTIEGSKGNITWDFVSGTIFADSSRVNYGPGPGRPGPQGVDKAALAYVAAGDVGPGKFGPYLSSSTYHSDLDGPDISVQCLVYMPSESYAASTVFGAGAHSFSNLGFYAGSTKGFPQLYRTWDFYFDPSPTDVSLIVQTNYGDSESVEAKGKSAGGFPGIDSVINLDGWNHFAFSRRSFISASFTNIVDIYVNGVLVQAATGSSVEVSGTGGAARDFDQNVRIPVLSVGSYEFSLAGSPPPDYSFPAMASGIRVACLKITSGSLTQEEITGGVNYEFLRSTTASLDGYIIKPGYVNDTTGEQSFVPFDGLGNEKLVNKLSTSDDTILTFLRNSSSLNLDDDIREQHGIKSSPAGGDVYGPDQAQYGTDSIAFSGFYRGS